MVETAAASIGNWQIVTEVLPAPDGCRCTFSTGVSIPVSPVLGSRLRPNDRLIILAADPNDPAPDLLIDRPGLRPFPQLLSATIGYAAQPKEGAQGIFVRVELPRSIGPKGLYLSAAAVREYFYLLGEHDSPRESLYDLLQTSETATPADLRLAWRLQSVEFGMAAADRSIRSRAERAFNILAHPDLRNCYDRMQKDEDAPPLLPYGGFGSILAEGHLSEDGQAFFGERILAYKPETTTRKVSLLFRRCEFFFDRVICRDPRRKIEVWLDGNLLPGLSWDLTWNNWKHWLKSRLEVEATLVSAGKYRLTKGEWILRKWSAALPSRLRVSLPEGLAADIARARALHSLLGEHADLVRHAGAQIEKYPVEHTTIQKWFDDLAVSTDLKPHYVNWLPDYEPYYFEQLRKRSRTWFLFRNEYLFVWPKVLISEIPEPGHATYLFSHPAQLDEFMQGYAGIDRNDVRHNRDDVASRLGFIGRVVRGRRKQRWLNDVLKRAGEKADYVESFE